MKSGPKPIDPIVRFKRLYMPCPVTGCWVWIGAMTWDGYGKFGDRTGHYIVASRASWKLFRGEIPKGMCVLHKCDVRYCVNPDHLFLGTLADNVHDMHKKGRFRKAEQYNPRRGTTHTLAKLDDDKVRQIRSSTKTEEKMAEEFCVSRTTIHKAKSRKTWKHVT